DASAVRMRDLPYDEQPEPEPLLVFAAAGLDGASLERIEQLAEVGGVDGRTFVGHLEPDLGPVADERHSNGRVRGPVLDRIADKVANELPETPAIPLPLGVAAHVEVNLSVRVRAAQLFQLV